MPLILSLDDQSFHVEQTNGILWNMSVRWMKIDEENGKVVISVKSEFDDDDYLPVIGLSAEKMDELAKIWLLKREIERMLHGDVSGSV